MTVTLKWIVNSLLYRNGHVTFMEILKYALHQFCQQAQAHSSKPQQQNHSHGFQPVHGQVHKQPLHDTLTRVPSHAASHHDENDEDEDAMSARDYLAEHPVIDAGKFEQVWATATEIASLSYTLHEAPEKDDIIELFSSNCLSCLASGSVNHLFKFFFFAEMVRVVLTSTLGLLISDGTTEKLTSIHWIVLCVFASQTELQCVFCVEMAIDAESGGVEGTIKRLAVQQRDEEEEDLIDSSFVSFFEDVLQEL
ncbi:hypothetical protein BBJ28_00009142 [Nothophytophthora sp. Chile5]|nr:hypothetical protein BBJ28_00009142 [Nothophytophthora sp. Chile5]